MEITKRYAMYKNFGRCAILSNGSIEVYATMDFGPRLIRLASVNGENMLYEDIERSFFASSSLMDEVYYPGACWQIYGGHRVWLSPENMPKTYYPDNEPVRVEELENGFRLTAPKQQYNEIQFSLVITMSEQENRLWVRHECTNYSAQDKRFAIWALTAFSDNALQIVEIPHRNTGVFANRCIPLWPGSDMRDERVYWGSRFITLRHSRIADSPFKFAINDVESGAVLCNGNLLKKRFTRDPYGEYPDFGSNWESYTCKDFLECESLSKLFYCGTGETVSYTEEWEVYQNMGEVDGKDEDAIERLLSVGSP